MNEIVTCTIGDALYSEYWLCSDACRDPDDPYGRKPTHRCYAVKGWPITKVTPQRIYFVDPGGDWRDDRTYFIERSKFDELANGYDEVGRAYHRSLREYLYLTTDPLTRWHAQEERIRNLPAPKTVSELRKEMADAHPDRGGDRDVFQAARRRYLAAKAAGGDT